MCGVFLPICSSVQDVVASPDRVGLTAGLADSGKRSGDPACPQSEGREALFKRVCKENAVKCGVQTGTGFVRRIMVNRCISRRFIRQKRSSFLQL